MVLRIFLCLAVVGLLASCSEGEVSTVKPVDGNIEVDGEMLYLNQCVSCHGPKGDLGNSGSKDLTVSKLSEAQVLKIIKEGKGTMPPFEYLLKTEKEREAVAEYAMSLRKGEK
jgi:mono/diheme cytochrome c family protein